MTLPLASESENQSTSVESVHPTPLVASDGTPLAAAVAGGVSFAGNTVTKTPSSATTAHADGEQTRSATVIEASMDANGVTTTTTMTMTTSPPPAPMVAVGDTSVKQDEVRTSPSKPTMVANGLERCELEGFTPFSKCHLWKLMMSFYDREGVESWAQGIVPHFITSNTFIAKRYSNVLRAYFRDVMRPGSEYSVSCANVCVSLSPRRLEVLASF